MAAPTTGLASLTLTDLIDHVARPEPTPGGGAVAAIVASLDQLAVSGSSALRSDACAATLLASAVAARAAILVGENLRTRPGDPRVAEAGRCAMHAATAAERVVAPYDYLREVIRDGSGDHRRAEDR